MIYPIYPNEVKNYYLDGQSIKFKFDLQFRSDLSLRITSSQQLFLNYRIYNEDDDIIVDESIRSSVIIKLIKLVAGSYILELYSPIIQGTSGTIYYEIEEYKVDVPFLEPVYYYNTHMNYNIGFTEDLGVEINIPVYFEIIEGRLPPNFTMNELGQISSNGDVMELDCMEDNASLSPSGIWYYEDGSEAMSWGRQWGFKVRATIRNDAYIYEPVERWYCIRIYNNYDHERDNYLNNHDNFYRVDTEEFMVDNPEYTLPTTLCKLTELKNELLESYNMKLYEIVEDPCSDGEDEIEKQHINLDREVYIIPFGVSFEYEIPSLIQRSVEQITVRSNDIAIFKSMIANSRLLRQIESSTSDYEIISYIDRGKLYIERKEIVIPPSPPDERIDPIVEFKKMRDRENQLLPFMSNLSFGIHMEANFNFYKNS